jgi:hypothetical protein
MNPAAISVAPVSGFGKQNTRFKDGRKAAERARRGDGGRNWATRSSILLSSKPNRLATAERPLGSESCIEGSR